MPKPKKARIAIKLPDTVNVYISSCCSVDAKKPSVYQIAKENPAEGDRLDGAKRVGGEGTLGKWRCGQCGKRCTVSVAKKAQAGV